MPFGLQRLGVARSEEHTSELQSRGHLVCRLLLEKKKHIKLPTRPTDNNTEKKLNILRYIVNKVLFFSLFIALCTINTTVLVFFFNDTATTEIYTLSLHDALPI